MVDYKEIVKQYLDNYISLLYENNKPKENEDLVIMVSANIFDDMVNKDYLKEVNKNDYIFKYKDYENLKILKNYDEHYKISYCNVKKDHIPYKYYQYTFDGDFKDGLPKKLYTLLDDGPIGMVIIPENI